MSLDMYGEYGPGRDFSNDPPSSTKDVWTSRLDGFIVLS